MTLALLCFFAALVLVLGFGKLDRSRPLAVGIALLGAAVGSYLTSRRTIHPLDDIVNYHDLFFAISSNDWSWLENVGGGLEFGLPFILFVFNLLLGDLTLKGLLFWLTFLGTASAIGAYAWLIPQVTDRENFGLKLAFSLAFISFFTASHTTRQFLAGIALLPILVLALTPRKLVGWGLLSTIIHSTSLLFVGILTLCRSRWGIAVIAVAGPWVVVSIDTFLLVLRTLTPAIVQHKLTLLTLQTEVNQDISNIPDLVRLALLAALVFGTNLLWPDSVPTHTRRYVYIGFAVFALLVGVPFVGNRLNHMLLNVAFGLLVMMASHKSPVAMRGLLLAGLAYQVRLLSLY